MIIKNWAYGETQYYTEKGKDKRREVEFVGRMSKNAFFNTILDGNTRGRTWILERISNTGNRFALKTINENPDKVVCYDKTTHKILKVLDKYTARIP